MKKPAKRVMLLGATGTAGQATARALMGQGFDLVCFGRSRPDIQAEVTFRQGDVTSRQSMRQNGFCGEHFDVLVSCLASRSGEPKDAWAIDHDAHVDALACALESGVKHMVLLSAICVQRPKLQFQFAKLAFEKTLIESGITYSIVRPTALFKSLSGQIERVRRGKPFLVFGNGELTACKPISDRDLANYMVQCITDTTLHNRILPIGGPGPAITPRQQGEELSARLGKTPSFRHVPVGMLNIIIGALTASGLVIPACTRKAELARIGRYYATESMLVFDHANNRYDPEATPSTGNDTLFQFYEDTINNNTSVKLREHAVF
jgi:divinyl chlorophyllide a 8-vinyl-reductase